MQKCFTELAEGIWPKLTLEFKHGFQNRRMWSKNYAKVGSTLRITTRLNGLALTSDYVPRVTTGRRKAVSFKGVRRN